MSAKDAEICRCGHKKSSHRPRWVSRQNLIEELEGQGSCTNCYCPRFTPEGKG